MLPRSWSLRPPDVERVPGPGIGVRESGCGNRGAANDDVVQRLRPQGILGLGRGCNTSTCTLAGRVLTWW